jgi:hypothetical protein
LRADFKLTLEIMNNPALPIHCCEQGNFPHPTVAVHFQHQYE